MDPDQYTNLLQALAQVPDPRKPRGKQHQWTVVLAVLCAAVASGQRSVRAIAQWAKEHEAELVQHLQPTRQRLPSASTLYRVMRRVDVASVDDHLTRFSYSCEQEALAAEAAEAAKTKLKAVEAAAAAAAGAGAAKAKPKAQDKRKKRKGRQRFVGQSVDGKELRGARAH